jgi:hypothetical protein
VCKRICYFGKYIKGWKKRMFNRQRDQRYPNVLFFLIHPEVIEVNRISYTAYFSAWDLQTEASSIGFVHWLVILIDNYSLIG